MEVFEAINQFWSKITPQYCQNYIKHLKKVFIPGIFRLNV
jgi:hypothetical protein